MPEDTPEEDTPVAVETLREPPKSKKQAIVVVFLMFSIVVFLITSPDSAKTFWEVVFGNIGTDNTTTNISAPTIIVDEVRIVNVTLPAEEKSVDLNFTISNVTWSEGWTILIQTNDSLDNIRAIVKFNRAIEMTKIEFVRSINYRGRRYYLWLYNASLMALDVTNKDKEVVEEVIRKYPPMEELY